MSLESNVKEAAAILKRSGYTTAYTGAGISVESGIPPFRGENGLWSRYDPKCLDLGFFMDQPADSWAAIREIFFDFFGQARPNTAHLVLSRLEQHGFIHRLITQNIDNLHQEAGSKQVFEFHGNSKRLLCLACLAVYPHTEVSLDHLPPTCRQCGGLLKPDFVFFGEPIPPIPLAAASEAASSSSVFLIIGTTGEVMPANQFPVIARSNGAVIIEINPEESLYTAKITDIFLRGPAGKTLELLEKELLAPAL